MKQLHKIQRKLLKKLLFAKSLRFSDLKPEDMEGSQFTFHMDNLVNNGWVEKVSVGKYQLTPSGKEYANRMEAKSAEIRVQPKITTILCAVKTNTSPKEYLLYTRLKNPFYGCQGFPTEKVWIGENIEDAATRGLKEETGLSGKPQLIAIRHYRVFSKQSELLEDKVMFAFKFDNPKGKLIGNKEGDFKWIAETEIEKTVKRPLEEFKEIYALLQSVNGEITFKEVQHVTDIF